jgi:hypothetical protein
MKVLNERSFRALVRVVEKRNIGLYKLACQKQLDLVRATKSFLFNQKYGRELARALDFKVALPLDKRLERARQDTIYGAIQAAAYTDLHKLHLRTAYWQANSRTAYKVEL